MEESSSSCACNQHEQNSVWQRAHGDAVRQSRASEEHTRVCIFASRNLVPKSSRLKRRAAGCVCALARSGYVGDRDCKRPAGPSVKRYWERGSRPPRATQHQPRR
eukprot:6195887-Pleurochrysis_carterae.AAC.4